jgi:hypothetical protein
MRISITRSNSPRCEIQSISPPPNPMPTKNKHTPLPKEFEPSLEFDHSFESTDSLFLVDLRIYPDNVNAKPIRDALVHRYNLHDELVYILEQIVNKSFIGGPNRTLIEARKILLKAQKGGK